MRILARHENDAARRIPRPSSSLSPLEGTVMLALGNRQPEAPFRSMREPPHLDERSARRVSERLTRYLVRTLQWKVREESFLDRKNPFGPEEKTAPSVRNPVLEAMPERAAVAVVELAPPPRDVRGARPAFALEDAERERANARTIRRTDDTAGPSTPRPGLALETVPRLVAGAAFVRALPLGPRDAFVLAHLDGESDLRMLVDITGMTRLEVSMIIEKLVDLGAVELA